MLMREVVYAVEDKSKTLRTDRHNYKLESGKLTERTVRNVSGVSKDEL
jgi:hypothetical protein